MWDNLLQQLQTLPVYIYNLILLSVGVIIGLIFRAITSFVFKYYAKKNANNDEGEFASFSFIKSAFARLGKPLTFLLPLLVINGFLGVMELTPVEFNRADKTVGVLLIINFAWLIISIIKMAEDYVYFSFNLKKKDNLRERKIRTQLQFLRKLAIVIIVLLAIGAILLSFDSLRKIGSGLLAGVGVGGVIIGLAAQKSISNFLAGFQIAFTQPMRIDDVLIVEGEYGRVEEINLTYVVLVIWDERRLILPINYFIEKPFQNWTRRSSEILGTVFLYLDYNAPVELIRMEFLRLLQGHELWDKRVAGLQITNASEQTIEIRALMSAASSSESFDLRCFIREKLVAFVNENHPECLPKTRAMVNDTDGKILSGEGKPQPQGA